MGGKVRGKKFKQIGAHIGYGMVKVSDKLY
jgi:hypothetical protein